MVIVYAVAAGAVTGWRYFVLSNIVDDALIGELSTAAQGGIARGAGPERVRHTVLRSASAAAVPLNPDELTVFAEGNAVTVRVRHMYQVFEYGARRLEIPITIERSRAID